MKEVIDIGVNLLTWKYKKLITLSILIFILCIGAMFGILFLMAGTLNSNVKIGYGDATISEIGEAQIPSQYIPIYKAAAEKYDVPWNILAAEHRVETRFSTMDPMISPVGAVGHLQFMPCTWIGWSYPGCSGLGQGNIPNSDLINPAIIKKYGGYGVDANNDGKADPFDLEDAIFSSAKYLSKNGASSGNIEKAIYAYNHSQSYVNEVLHFAELYVSAGVVIGGEKFIWPVKYTTNITSPFGSREDPFGNESEFHKGMDISAPGIAGKTVYAIADGKVTYAGPMNGYGNVIIINHGNGIESRYGHLSKIKTETGKKVDQGQKIGNVGNTGQSTGYHLHLEIRINDKPVDPMNYYRDINN